MVARRETEWHWKVPPWMALSTVDTGFSVKLLRVSTAPPPMVFLLETEEGTGWPTPWIPESISFLTDTWN